MPRGERGVWGRVTCRIGSLEIVLRPTPYCSKRYLPNRQLRNVEMELEFVQTGYLPNRQLRNSGMCKSYGTSCYLPNRQLRN